MKKIKLFSLFLISVLVASSGPLSATEEAVTFEKDVFPLLDRRCSGCHFPEVEDLKGGLDLSTLEATLKGGTNGKSIIPGNAAESPLVLMLEWKLEPHMPPPKDFKRLRSSEIDIIKLWIDQGARSEKELAEGGEAKIEAKETAEGPKKSDEPKSDAMPESVGEGEKEKEEEKELNAMPAPVSALAFSPDGSLLAQGGLHNVDLLAVTETGELTHQAKLEGHEEMVRALAFSPDGKTLAAAGGHPGRAGEVLLWNVSDRSLIRKIEGHDDNILAIAFRADGKRLATSSYDRLVKIWDAETGEEIRTLKNHVDAVFSVAYSPDGKRLASASGDRTVKIWDTETGDLLLTLSDSLDAVYAVAFSPSGNEVAAGAADKMIRVWDLGESPTTTFSQSQINAGKLLGSSFAHEGAVIALAYSPDGSEIYSTAEDQRIKVWDAKTLTEKRVFEKQSDWVSAIAISPDGKKLAAGRYDSSSALYAADSGKLLAGTNPREAVAIAKPDDAPEEKKETETADAAANDTIEEKKVNKLDVGAVVINATIPPSASSISPRFVHRGSEVEFTINGKNLEGAEPHFSHPSFKPDIVSVEALPIPEVARDNTGTGAQIIDNAQPYRIKLKLPIAEDAPLGGHSVMFRTPLGISSSVSFIVTPWPDTGEAEPNDELPQAQAITWPATITGAMQRAGDIDRYKVTVEAGKELVFALTDTGLNASMRILNAAGETIATSDEFSRGRDARVGFRAEAAGDYYLEVSDRDLRRGPGYRLHAGEFPFVTHVDPLGIPAGPPRMVAVRGFNLGASEYEVDPPDEAAYGQTIGLPIPGVEGNPVPNRSIAVGPAEEIAEAEPNDASDQAQAIAFPATVNGKIQSDDREDFDLYRFTAKKGETIVIETMARRLGSSLDSVLDVLDANGELLMRAKARCVAQTVLTLSGRDSFGAGIRLENWTDLRMNDYMMIGPEIIQVTGIPDYGDEDVVFRAHPNGQRKGFFGTTPVHHAVNAPAYKVEIHPPDAMFAPNGMPVFPLYWRNDDAYFEGAGAGDSQIEFVAPRDGEFIVRVRDASGASGEDYGYRLLLRKLEPNFDLFANPYRIDIAAGDRATIDVRVRRRDGFNEPVTIDIDGLPEGFSATSETVLPGEENVRLMIAAPDNAESTPLDWTYKVVAKTTLNGEETTREANLGAITIVKSTPDLIVHNGESRVALEPGKAVTVTVKLDRNNGFANRVPIDVLNLPYGVRILDTGLNGILVRPGETTRTMEIYAEPWVEPMKRTIHLQARIESTSRSPVFVGPPIDLVIGRPEEEPKVEKPSEPAVAETWDEEKLEAFIAALKQ